MLGNGGNMRYLEERITELEQTVDALTDRLAALEARVNGTDTITIGDEIEEIESGDRGIVTRIKGDKVYALWYGTRELFVKRNECRKVVK